VRHAEDQGRIISLSTVSTWTSMIVHSPKMQSLPAECSPGPERRLLRVEIHQCVPCSDLTYTC
jgi:hypothetical protein